MSDTATAEAAVELEPESVAIEAAIVDTAPKKRATRKRAAPKKKAEPEPPSFDGFDLDAAIAEVTDPVEATPFVFSYAGKVWSMRAISDSDAKLMANIELNEIQQVMSYIRDLLGDQWSEFPRISYQGAMVLIEQYTEAAQGVGVGESEAPTNS